MVSANVADFRLDFPAADDSLTAELTPTLYRQLRQIACRHLSGERKNHTLQPTALVHEAYLKLGGVRERAFTDEVHFLAVASRVMRQVLVDYARSRSAQKRFGGFGVESISATEAELRDDGSPELMQIIYLDNALSALAGEDEILSRLVEMRYFGGLTAEESAEALGISVHVVRHQLRYAQAWLRRKMSC